MKKLVALALLLPAFALAIYDMKWFDLNHWKSPFLNDGRWGIDITQGVAGGSWPQPLKNFYVFGAGPWVGCTIGSDTFVTIGYNPNTCGTEFGPILCRYWRQGTADSADRVYKYPGDWPPPQGRFPMAPQQPRSEMDMWCCSGDSDPRSHVAQWSPMQVALAGNYAYLACGATGLSIVNVSNPQSPVEVGRCRTPDDAWGVALVGNYAYVTARDSGLCIIDVSNPESPCEVGRYDTPGFASGVALAGDCAYVADLFYLRIIDVSDPQNPQGLGSCRVPYLAWRVAVAGNYAYVTTSDSGLRIIDVSNPASPHEAAHCLTPRYAEDVAVAGSYAYVAVRDSGLRIVNVSDPESPYEVGHYDTPGYAYGVAVAGSHAYLADSPGLSIIDVSDPENPYETGYCQTPGSSSDVAVAGNHAYVADGSAGLRVIDVSNPQSPCEVGSLSKPGGPLGIDIHVTCYGFTDSIAQDIIILKYELANSSGSRLDRAYFGLVLDADVGDGHDDMTGLIRDRMFHAGPDTFRVKDVGYVYDLNNNENPGQHWESGTPGAVAVRLLQAHGGLGLTAFKRYTVDIDPVTDPDQYLTLAGYDYRTRVYSPFDSVDFAAGDKRALLATGPFDLAAGSVAVFYYAVVGAPYGDLNQPPQNRDTTELALRCWWAESVFKRVVGIAEEPAMPRSVPPIATIVRGVFVLPQSLVTNRQSPAALLDASGRKVLELLPGPNDVRHLAPGVYFVRTGPPAGGRQPPAVRRVIVVE